MWTCRKKYQGTEETKILVMKDAFSREFVPQSKCSEMEITRYKKRRRSEWRRFATMNMEWHVLDMKV